ncbi:conserved hypothetical protein [Pantoea brenneri]|uniref:Uncharacterized protein n=1 Tax=Pantoea brenneri TaxID=472694 RepID=A0AAX3J3U2_9GAMM|nr:hypothetical protein [Pantoea brenneri]VXB50815.1 conserved hypothetical protein [Pantoea brenneri]
MKKLTPGGMAVIIGSIGDAFRDNVGRVVRTVYHEGMLPSPLTGMKYDCWFVEVPDGAEPLKAVTPNGQISMKYFGNIPAAILMPLDNQDPDITRSAAPVYGSMGAL